jgi:hypothetical protein
MHCLIVCDDAGLRVRRWTSETWLNGEAFDEAPLADGDCLSIGPIVLEIVAADAMECALPLVETPHEVSGRALSKLDEVETSLNAWSDGAMDSHVDAGVENPLARECPPGNGFGVEGSAIGVEILAALGGQREQFTELLSRVHELEQKVELALASSDAAQSSQRGLLEPDRFQAAHDQPAWTQRWTDDAAHSANLDADLSLAQQQLADALAELAEAQATIDDLQTRLVEGQRAWRELSDERAAWQQQLDDFKRQIADHAAQAEELQKQLQKSQLIESDKEFGAAGDVAEAEEKSSTPETTLSASAKVDDGYDWSQHTSAHSPEAVVESYGLPPAEDVTDADEDRPTQTPWTLPDPLDVTSDESVDQTGAGNQSIEQESAASWPDTLPADRSPHAAGAMSSAAEESTNPPGDIDEALAHLRELTLWRRVPDSSTEDESKAEPNHRNATWSDTMADEAPKASAAVESMPIPTEPTMERSSGTTPLVIEPGPNSIADVSAPVAKPSSASSSTSFIDRYAHMFENDDQVDEPRALAPTFAPKDVPARLVDRDAAVTASTSPIGPTAAASVADESMEQYMARMMQRIRGDAPNRASSLAPPEEQAIETVAGSNPSKGNSFVVGDAATNRTVGATTESSSPNTEPLISLQELKRKNPTPEFTSDLGAMRALANQTARHAIGVHTMRTLRRNAKTRFIVSLLAGMTSLYFMLNSTDWQSHEFSTGCVALIAAIYWGRLTFVSVIKAVKVGAFDDYDESFTAVEPASPALPIDIERR